MTHPSEACVKCDATRAPMELTEDGWVCLPCTGRRPHLTIVPDAQTPLESLLLASLTAKGAEMRAMTQVMGATLDAVARRRGVEA